jgi:hypothetical protein
VILLLASPLLAIAGLYDVPFRVQTQELVRLVLSDGGEILQGCMDVLALQVSANTITNQRASAIENCALSQKIGPVVCGRSGLRV